MRQVLTGLLFIACSAHAEIRVEKITVTTNAICSPATGVNYGTINVYCTDPDLEEKYRNLPGLTKYNLNMEKLELMRTHVASMVTELRMKESDSRVTQKNISRLRDNLRQTEKAFSELWRGHEELRFQLAAVMAKLSDFTQGKIESTVKVIGESVAQAVYEQQFQKLSRSLYYDIDKKLKDYRDDLENLKVRVDALQNDVSFLMNEFLEGNLKENVGFFGLSIGGTYLSSAWQPRIAIEFEILMPKIRLLNARASWFAGLSHINWKEKQSYQTLPGSSPIEVIENNEVTLLSIGSRLYMFEWNDELQTYMGATFGLSVLGEEDTFNYGFIMGTEYFRKTSRIALELRWDGFSKIEREETTFNPLGSATVTTVTESLNGWYVGIKVAFR